MNKETEELQKAINLGQQAVEILSKSHVKEYTRTTASGANVQVKEHDDKRQAAQAASEHADKSSKAVLNNPKDIRVHAANHADAAFAHIEALKHATTNEDINHHFRQASRHMMANDSLHSFANGLDHKTSENKKTTQHADNSEKHAWDIGKHAKDTKVDESTSEGLNKKSSLHMLAMEHHQRVADNHMVAASRNYDDKEVGGYHDDHSQDNRTAAREHGDEVQRVSQIAIRASDKAYKASDKAKKSDTPENHKEASNAHREAAKLDWDSESKSEHEAKAAEHDKKAEKSANTDWHSNHEAVTKMANKEEGYDDGEDMHLAAAAMKRKDHGRLKKVLQFSSDYTKEKVAQHIHQDHWEGLGIKAKKKPRLVPNPDVPIEKDGNMTIVGDQNPRSYSFPGRGK